MKNIFKKLVALIGVGLFAMNSGLAQSFAVQSSTQLIPPYSVYLTDYATPGNEKLQVILVQRDLTQPSYQVRLVMVVELEGRVIMRTSRTFNPRPISLDPGIPTVISGADLASYLDSRNIDFVGYSRDQYERTKALPEGQYNICFIAYDFRRQDVQVSNNGCSFYYLSKNEPPLTNFPICGNRIMINMPQQIIFSWLPRNTASPNSAADTQYEFTLFETRPEGRNPNDVVLTTQPVFRTLTDFTQLVYGPGEPVLFEGMTYVWRVRAIDKNGKDAFRNNGYSEVCTFRYGGFDPQFDIGVVKGLQAIGEKERIGRIWWDELSDIENYKIEYKKSGKDYRGDEYEWHYNYLPPGNTEIKIYDLEPDTEYQTRIAARKKNAFGPYSEIIKFRTKPQQVFNCGENNLPQITPANPIANASAGMVVNARGFDMTLVEIMPLNQPGYFKGIGFINNKFFGGARFYTKFDHIFIDENRNVAGPDRIDIVTEGVANMIQQQLADQKGRQLEQQQKENREQWADTEFHEDIFVYDEIEIFDVAVDEIGNVIITDTNGATHTNTEIVPIITNSSEKAVIIEDKNGDQYVVQKDKSTGQTKVTKVEGGGLQPGSKSDTQIQSDPIKDRIIVLILEQFQEEINAWLRINGKGGEEDEDVLLAADLPQCFPRNENILKHINESTIPHFKQRLTDLRGKIEATPAYKELLNGISKQFTNATAVNLNNLSEADKEAVTNATCEAIVKADLAMIDIELSRTGVSKTDPCWLQGYDRAKQLYGEYEFGIAVYAGFIRYLVCETEKDKCGQNGVEAYSCGITNGLLQELDWVALLEIEGFTEEDIANLILCVKESFPIGGRVEDNPELYKIIFKCITGVEIGEMGNAIKGFIVENWNESYYQGQATAFVLTLFTPFKAKIVDKLRNLPKYASKISKLESLAKAKNVDELVQIAKSLTKRVDELVAKLPTRLKNTYNELITAGLKSSSDNKNAILLLTNEGEEIASIVGNKFTPKKWAAFSNALTKVETSEGYWLIKDGNEILGIDIGFKQGRVLDASEVNEYWKVGKKGYEPYKPGTKVIERELHKGETLYIVEYIEQNRPGAFASKDRIKTVAELRKDLAVLKDWKDQDLKFLTVREYRVRSSLNVREGVIGPQIEEIGLDKGKLLSGGGHQYEFLEKWDDRRFPHEDFLEFIVNHEIK